MNEPIVVIGGGIAGCTAAIRLRQAGFKDIRLLESERSLCTASSATVSEAHSGAEYPTDIQSACDCLRGLVHLVRTMPAQVFKPSKTRVLISEATAQAGEITPELFEHTIRHVQEEYERLLRKDPRNEVIGRPSDFWRSLAETEYSVNQPIAGGYETPQRGINSIHLAAVLSESLKELGVQTSLSTQVSSLRRTGAGFLIQAEQDGASVSYSAKYVVVAAGYHGFTLARMVADPDYKHADVILGLRQIVVVDRSQTQFTDDATTFVLEGEHGGLESPVNRDFSYVYHPPTSQIENRMLDRKNYAVPPEWQKQLLNRSEEADKRSNAIVKGAILAGHSHLVDAEIVSPQVKIAVKSDWNPRKRPNQPVSYPTRGCVNLSFITKATTAPLNAEVAVGKILEWAQEDGCLTTSMAREGIATLQTSPIPMPKVLKDRERCAEILGDTALNLDLPVEMVGEGWGGDSIPGCFSEEVEKDVIAFARL